MVSLASSLNPLQETGFIPRKIYDAEARCVYNLSHYLVCISFYEFMPFKQHVGHTLFQGFEP